MEAKALPMRALTVVGVDLMGTVVTPKSYIYYDHVVRIYTEVGFLHELELSSKQLKRLILGTIANLRGELLDSVEPSLFWRVTNARFLCKVHPDRWGTDALSRPVLDAARLIHERIESRSDMVEVTSKTRHALGRLGRCPVRVVVASNQTCARYEQHITGFGLRRYFDAEYISDSQGGPEGRPTGLGDRKPQPGFLSALLAHEGIRASTYLHVGNSFNNDAPLAHDARVVIVDRHHRYVDKNGFPRRPMRMRAFRRQFGDLIDRRRLVVVPSMKHVARLVEATYTAIQIRTSDPSLSSAAS